MFYTPGPVIYTGAGWYGIKCPGGQMETEREQCFKASFSKAHMLPTVGDVMSRKCQDPPVPQCVTVKKKKLSLQTEDAGTNISLTECSPMKPAGALRPAVSSPDARNLVIDSTHENGGHDAEGRRRKVGKRCMCVNTCRCQSLNLTAPW